MDAHYYLETIQTVFQEFKLVNGTWDVLSPEGRCERVRPQDIQGTALLSIEGELDDISGSGQTRAAHELCTGIAPAQRRHLEVAGAGHYGIFSGRRWRESVYPEVRGFIAAHQMPQPRAATGAAAGPVDEALPAAAVTASATARTRRPARKA
jgi:poly(3-hydroxybutyrate) depolymerase